ncbi:MAG: response regulator [Deltaproteobacteria bacterium]|nr:response regulator [Deltaproteobacteria bacterium]
MEQMLIEGILYQEDKKKILIVDDYLPTRKLIAEALTQTGTYEVTEASDGTEALKAFQDSPHDMVICDIMMPGMSGIELLSILREINPCIPVIMITAHPALELSVSAMKKGAVDFLKKPFDIDDLIFKVGIYLREKSLLQYKDIEDEETYLRLKNKTKELSVQSYIYDALENTGGDRSQTFQKTVELAIKIVDGESGSLYLFDAEVGEFKPQIIKSNEGGANHQGMAPMLNNLFRMVVEKKEALMLNSENDPVISPSLICAPLMIRDNVLGILSVRKKKDGRTFTKKDLHYILSLTKRASLNLENAALYESIYTNLMDTFQSLVASIQVRDHYTELHSRRVADLAITIAERMNCSEKDIESLKIAGTLHDVGKISIPDRILLKSGKLTPEEYAVVKNHPSVGDGILKSIVIFDNERIIINHHHERWDGTGYPDGLVGKDIPFLARILAVADSFDAMTTDRPYRKAMTLDNAVAELERSKGTCFDGAIVDCFVDTL